MITARISHTQAGRELLLENRADNGDYLWGMMQRLSTDSECRQVAWEFMTSRGDNPDKLVWIQEGK